MKKCAVNLKKKKKKKSSPSPTTAASRPNAGVLLPCLELLCTKMASELAMGGPLMQNEEYKAT